MAGWRDNGPMTDPLIWLGVALLGLIAILLVLTSSRLPRRGEILTNAALQPQWQQIKTDGERLERELRG